jgi:hypothetical protein
MLTEFLETIRLCRRSRSTVTTTLCLRTSRAGKAIRGLSPAATVSSTAAVRNQEEYLLFILIAVFLLLLLLLLL